MSNRVKCAAEGCTGWMDVETDGRGGTRETPCPYCARREVWRKAHLPDPPKSTCAICTAPTKQPRNGQPAYCAACLPLRQRELRRKDREKKHARQALALRGRKSA